MHHKKDAYTNWHMSTISFWDWQPLTLSKAELPHPVYACVFRIALHFPSNYVVSFTQCEIACTNGKWQRTFVVLLPTKDKMKVHNLLHHDASSPFNNNKIKTATTTQQQLNLYFSVMLVASRSILWSTLYSRGGSTFCHAGQVFETFFVIFDVAVCDKIWQFLFKFYHQFELLTLTKGPRTSKIN